MVYICRSYVQKSSVLFFETRCSLCILQVASDGVVGRAHIWLRRWRIMFNNGGFGIHAAWRKAD